MKNAWYDATAQSWRPPAEVPMHFMALAQLFPATAIGGLIAIGYRPGLLYGAGVGALAGLFAAGANLVGYTVQPFPGGMVASWIVGTLIQTTLVGAAFSALYIPTASQNSN